MAPYTISGCTVADGAALSYNNISAFWEDPTWVLAWKHTTLEKHIETVAKRYPRNLLSNRASVRHQKAVDENGRLVGYCRWVLPSSHAGFATWPEAITPAVSPEKEAEIRRAAALIVWNPNEESDELDTNAGKITNKVMARKPYLRLDYLAVHPDNRGKGIATALVESGMRQANLLGLDIFVHAFRAGMGVYKRLGFRIEEELIRKCFTFVLNHKLYPTVWINAIRQSLLSKSARLASRFTGNRYFLYRNIERRRLTDCAH